MTCGELLQYLQNAIATHGPELPLVHDAKALHVLTVTDLDKLDLSHGYCTVPVLVEDAVALTRLFDPRPGEVRQ